MAVQKGHDCTIIVCTCGNIIQSCTCRNFEKRLEVVTQACYICMGVKLLPLTKEDVQYTLGSLVKSTDFIYREPKSITYYFSILMSQGLNQTDISAAFFSLVRRGILTWNPDRTLVPGPPMSHWMDTQIEYIWGKKGL